MLTIFNIFTKPSIHQSFEIKKYKNIEKSMFHTIQTDTKHQHSTFNLMPLKSMIQLALLIRLKM